jgi:competence protein ComEC
MSLVRRPSPVAGLLAAVAGGTALGLLVPHPWIILGAASVAAVLVGAIAPVAVVWSLAMLLGAGHGIAARAEDAEGCRSQLAPGPAELTVVLEEPTTARAVILATPLGLSCRGPILLRWPDSREALAGQVMAIEGRWTIRPGALRADGLLVVDRFGARGARQSSVRRLRNWLGLTIDRLFGPRAGMVGALVLNTRGSIDPELMQSFARAGLVHLLSISGFHVGLIAGWIVLIGRALRRPKLQAELCAVIVAVVYVGFIGAPAPALRAAILAAIGLVERWRQRAVSPGPLFAFTALLVVLVDPWALLDLGAWLSVTALFGATGATRWVIQAGWSSTAARIVAASVGATVATAPVAAAALGNVSVIGIGLNLVGIPLAAVAVPGVLATLLAAPIASGVARSMAAGSGLTLNLLESLAVGGARAPGAAVVVDAGVSAGLVGVFVVIAAVWVAGRPNTGAEAARRAAWLVAPIPLVMLLFGLVVRPHHGQHLTLSFLDVGQGDATLIETPHHHAILIDGGPVSRGRDAGLRVVVPAIRRLGIGRLDLVIVSHAHLDHYGGSAAVLRAVPTDLVAEPGEAVHDAGYIGWLDEIDRRERRWTALRAGQHFTIDGVGFEVLHPDPGWVGWGEDLNEDSVVLRLKSGRFDAWFPGDAGILVEETLAGRVGRIDLLKVGHHGSRTATGAAFLGEAAPTVAVVSTGPNRYGHPSPEALGRLAAARADVWRTDREGTVTVEVLDSTMRVSGRRGVRTYPLN